MKLTRVLLGELKKKLQFKGKFYDFNMMLAHPYWSKYREPPPPLRFDEIFRDIHWDPVAILQLSLRVHEGGDKEAPHHHGFTAEEIYSLVVGYRYPSGARIFASAAALASTVRKLAEEGLVAVEEGTSSSTSVSAAVSTQTASKEPSSKRRYYLTEKGLAEVYSAPPSFVPMTHYRLTPLPVNVLEEYPPSKRRLPPLPGTSEFQFLRQEWAHWDRIQRCWAGPQAAQKVLNPPFHIHTGLPKAPKFHTWEWFANHHDVNATWYPNKSGNAYKGGKARYA